MKKLIITLAASFLCILFAMAQTKETRNVSSFTKLSFRMPGKLYLRQGSPQKVEIQGRKDVLADLETVVEDGKLVIGREKKWSNWNFKDGDEITVYITVKDIEAVNVSGSGDIIGENKIIAKDLDLHVSGSGNMKIEADASGDIRADVSGSGDLTLTGKSRNFESDVSGSGKVIATLVVGEDIAFQISGSGKIQASGSASTVKASINGSGKVQAADLVTNRCDVAISGSGDVEINVKNELDAIITGSGTVNYRGNPSKVNSHSTGSGHVRKF